MNFNFNEYTGAEFTRCINKELKGTKTEKNLMEAYCGESKARNNYTYFAEKAKEEGYFHIAKIFEETALNEKEHAKIWLKLLNGGKLKSTKENLEEAANTENYEWENMYSRFAQDAREEGFNDIAFLFDTIRNIEKMHMTRYKKLINELMQNIVFTKPNETTWECGKCGYSFTGKQAPEICPFCKHPKGYFFEKKPD